MALWAAQCRSYDAALVDEAVDEIMQGLPPSAIKAGTKVLLKANVLSPKEPSWAVTTHPQVIRSLARYFQARGAVVAVGDSSGGIVPGGSRTDRALQVSGIAAAAEELGLVLENFDTKPAVAFENPRGPEYETIYLAQAVVDAELVISAAKLKTHSYTLYTGALKNLYGCIPGRRKAFYHGAAPTVAAFSEYLVDVYALVRPAYSIIDGITAMEGPGPAAGSPRACGGLFGGADAAALDAAACSLMGIRPEAVSMLTAARRRGLGRWPVGTGELFGPWDALRGRPFRGRKRNLVIPPGLRRVFSRALEAYPQIVQAECVRCRICLLSCPVKTIVQEPAGPLTVETNRCIQCYCCHELCPENAIEIVPSPFGRMLRRLRGLTQR